MTNGNGAPGLATNDCQGYRHNPKWGQPREPLLHSCPLAAAWEMTITYNSTPPITKKLLLCEAHAAEKRRDAAAKMLTIENEVKIPVDPAVLAKKQGAAWFSSLLRSFYRQVPGGVEVATVDGDGKLSEWKRDTRDYPPESARRI